MKNDIIHQEILLMTTATYLQREWCKNNHTNHQYLSNADQLEEACWNGALDELLPEIIKETSTGIHLSLWHIRNGSSFLQLALSECPSIVENRFSIDVLLFGSAINYN